MNVNEAISNAFLNLSNLSEQVYDYWLSELYDLETNEMIPEMWSEETLKMMEDDVMQLSNL